MRRDSHGPAGWLTLVIVALIAYGSLYPFDFNWQLAGGWRDALAQLSWARAGRGDRVTNVLLYLPFGLCFALWLEGGMRRTVAVLVTGCLGAALCVAIELAQAFIPARVPSLWDVTLNVCGTLAGACGGVAWRALSGRLPHASVAGRADRVAVVMVTLWFAWRWAPFDPQFALAKFKAALSPLADPALALPTVAHYLVWWLVVAQAVLTLSGAQRGVERLLAVMALLLVGRLFLTDPAFVPAELVALVLLLPVLVALYRLSTELRRRVLLAAFTLSWLSERLLSYDGPVASGNFDWWPFRTWLANGMPLTLAWWLRQLFEYAALFWLMRESGWAARTAAALLVGAVCGLELLAPWLPGRHGSIAAPCLAFCTAVALHYLCSRRPTRQLLRSR
jgi:VanZ family protein